MKSLKKKNVKNETENESRKFSFSLTREMPFSQTDVNRITSALFPLIIVAVREERPDELATNWVIREVQIIDDLAIC